jgi:hypothetical protein
MSPLGPLARSAGRPVRTCAGTAVTLAVRCGLLVPTGVDLDDSMRMART